MTFNEKRGNPILSCQGPIWQLCSWGLFSKSKNSESESEQTFNIKAVELCVLILYDFLLFVVSLQLACVVGRGRYFLSLSSHLLFHIFLMIVLLAELPVQQAILILHNIWTVTLKALLFLKCALVAVNYLSLHSKIDRGNWFWCSTLSTTSATSSLHQLEALSSMKVCSFFQVFPLFLWRGWVINKSTRYRYTLMW